jgi:flagellar basal body rod protein FlgG
MVESAVDPRGVRYRNPLYDRMTGGPWVRPTYHAFEQGPFRPGGKHDVAIDGDGFFTVLDGDQPRFTRDGRMMVNEQGGLVSVAGNGAIKFLDDGGSPIVVNRNQPVEITAGGTIEQNGTRVARLGVVDVDDVQKLRKVGKNLFIGTDDVQTQPTTSSLEVGFVEGSTVTPVDGLLTMIEVTRAYEMNARMITMQDQVNGEAVNRVGRIG